MHLSAPQNGILSALPYLGCWFGQNLSGIVADFLRRNGYLSTLATRRLFTFIGRWFNVM